MLIKSADPRMSITKCLAALWRWLVALVMLFLRHTKIFGVNTAAT